MYTVKHVLCCHFSLSLSYFHSSSIHLSLPSHLLHHLCSCNKQSSSCALFHSLDFHSLLILAHPPLQAWLPCLAVWLTCLHPAMALPCSQTHCVQKKKKRLSLCCHTVPSAVTQPQLAQHCFHLRVKVFWKQKCDDLTPLPRTKCTITQLHQNKSVSLSEWRACSPNRTIQVLNDSRLLIWASNHTDTSLSWVMEKDSICLWSVGLDIFFLV